MTRYLPIPLCLTLSAAACYLVQSHPYSPDPPNQTDRIFYKGWPRSYERTGGFAGFHDHYPAALALDIAAFLIPGLLLGGGIAAVLRRRTGAPHPLPERTPESSPASRAV